MVLYYPKIKFFEIKKRKAEYYFLSPETQTQTKHDNSRFFLYSLLIWRKEHYRQIDRICITAEVVEQKAWHCTKVPSPLQTERRMRG